MRRRCVLIKAGRYKVVRLAQPCLVRPNSCRVLDPTLILLFDRVGSLLDHSHASHFPRRLRHLILRRTCLLHPLIRTRSTRRRHDHHLHHAYLHGSPRRGHLASVRTLGVRENKRDAMAMGPTETAQTRYSASRGRGSQRRRGRELERRKASESARMVAPV